MIKAFLEGKDFHTATAAMIFKINHEEVNKNQRRIAKTINFGILYGQSAYGLSQQLGIGRNEAQNYIDRYFDRFAGLKIYIQKLIKQAERQGYVETLFGRRRYIQGINTNQYRQKAQAERMAVNTPFQGTNADIIKIAMISIDELLRQKAEGRSDLEKTKDQKLNSKENLNSEIQNLKSNLLMQVHDELVLECPRNNVEEISKLVKEEMEGVIELRVPLVVDVGVGDNWLETKAINSKI
jgi:DNA polymerase-1